MEKSLNRARIDRKFKHRDGNSKKKKKETKGNNRNEKNCNGNE